jgi:hypothetical protein
MVRSTSKEMPLTGGSFGRTDTTASIQAEYMIRCAAVNPDCRISRAPAAFVMQPYNYIHALLIKKIVPAGGRREAPSKTERRSPSPSEHLRDLEVFHSIETVAVSSVILSIFPGTMRAKIARRYVDEDEALVRLAVELSKLYADIRHWRLNKLPN